MKIGRDYLVTEEKRMKKNEEFQKPMKYHQTYQHMHTGNPIERGKIERSKKNLKNNSQKSFQI